MEEVLTVQASRHVLLERLTLAPLLSFEDACVLVIDYLKEVIPMASWSVTQRRDGRQLHVSIRDDAYGKTAGDSHAWSESFCQFMTVGDTPQIAFDAMAVPQYAGSGFAQDLMIGAYIGIPISDGDGELFGTICGLDPQRQDPALATHAPLLRLLSALLGHILEAERLRAESARAEAELHWRAFHDPLTRLPNRALFLDRLEHAVQMHRRDLRPLSVLMLDLDDFKLVNDGLGHTVGDELLIRVSERLTGALRAGDTLARLGGDEFAILIEDGADALLAADRLVACLQPPFEVGGAIISTGVSIGVAQVRPDSPVTDVESLLTQADVAMYQAKRDGKGQLAAYRPDMVLPGAIDLSLREPLRQALLDGTLTLAYQPIVDIDSRAVLGYEALSRWTHNGTNIAPDVFIPVAARASLLPALTDHVLEAAATQLARWSAERGDESLHIAVNVPPELFTDRDFPRRVDACMHRHGLATGQLVLELTEEAMLSDVPTAQQVALDLIEAGAALSLDDFGSGASSLTHLRALPLQSMKIDRSFTQDLDHNPASRQFMRALLSLGHDLGLSVIVEGVEREEQATILRTMGCRSAQGYLFGRPVPAVHTTTTHIRERRLS